MGGHHGNHNNNNHNHMYTTTKGLAAAAGVTTETIRRDVKRGSIRAEKISGTRGLRIPITGKNGANSYLRFKFPGRPLINP